MPSSCEVIVLFSPALYTHYNLTPLLGDDRSVVNKLEIRFRKHLAKLTGPAVRLDSKKPKGEKKR